MKVFLLAWIVVNLLALDLRAIAEVPMKVSLKLPGSLGFFFGVVICGAFFFPFLIIDSVMTKFRD